MTRTYPVALLCAFFGLSTSAAHAAEVVDRSEYTTTREVAPGELKTTVSPQPLNFQTASGEWKPVDLGLEPAGGGAVSPGAVDGELRIPETISTPVTVEHDGREVSIRLKGASGEASVDDATAVFDDALPGVEVQYEATPRGLKERLVLQSASAPVVFAYDVRAGAAWSAAVDDNGHVVLRDSAGVERYRITAPLAWDSAEDPAFTNDLRLSVSKVSDGRWTVTLRPSLEWLRDSAREFPVTLDPDFSWSNGTTTFNGATDTYLASGDQANSVFSAASYLQTGHYNRVYKSLLRFDVAAAIPTNAVVSAATFKAYAPPATPKSLASHSLRTVTAEWDANANWNRRKVGVSWTTLGGDVSSSSSYTSAATNVQTNPGWYSWSAPLATVQEWVAGTLPNYGFQLATNTGAPSGNAYVWASTEASTSSSFPADSTKRPILEVSWSVPDTTAPALTLSGELSSNQTNWRTTATGDITLAATDAGTGVKRLEILEGATVIQSDTQTCPAGGCSQNHTFTLDLDALGEGIHTLTAAAVDGGNLRTEQTFTVRVDQDDPSLSASGSLVDDQAEQISSGTRAVHVAAADEGSGIVDLELKVDGVQQEHVTQTCPSGGCSRTEDWEVDIAPLSEGVHAISITATDATGKTDTVELQLVKTAPLAPALTVTGDFVDAAAQGTLASDSEFVADVAADSGTDSIASISVWVGDILIDELENEQCTTNCSTLSGALDMSTKSLAPGTHQAKFKALDTEGRSSELIVNFTRDAEPTLAALVDDWVDDFQTAVETDGASTPQDPFPAPTDGVVAGGDCEAAPATQACIRDAAEWAASVQDWLLDADLPTASDPLPEFPTPALQDEMAAADVTDAIQGMLNLAEGVARNPDLPQPVGVTFETPLDEQAVVDWAAGRTVVSDVSVDGYPGAGNWSAQYQNEEPSSVGATLEDYFGSEEASGAETIEEIQAELVETPNDSALIAALADAEAYLDEVQQRTIRIEGISTTLTASAAATALSSAGSGQLEAVVAGAVGPGEEGAVVQRPTGVPTAAVAQRSAAAASHCDGQDKGWLPRNQTANVNPRYWAPTWFKGDSKLWRKGWEKGIRNGKKTGDKLHLLRAQWDTPHSLAWICAAPRFYRSIELEARVTEKKNREVFRSTRHPRWSTNWPRWGKYKRSNVPGGQGNLEYDDLAAGPPAGDITPGPEWLLTPDYPDFSIVLVDATGLNYNTRYWIDFKTNSGKTGENEQKGLVTYAGQATSWAGEGKTGLRKAAEFGYCGLRKKLNINRLRPEACHFARSTVCFGQDPISKSPRVFGSRLLPYTAWTTRIPFTAKFLDGPAYIPAYMSEQATSPCVAKPDELTFIAVPYEVEDDPGFPVAITEPALVGCSELGEACSVDPGTWGPGVSLTYSEGLCHINEPCDTSTTTPTVRWLTRADGACVIRRAAVTVIATDADGKTAWEPLEGPEVRDCPPASCNTSASIPVDPGRLIVHKSPWESWTEPQGTSAHFLANASGAATTISDPTLEERWFTWAPDRKRVIWQDGDNLYARTPDGSEPAQLLAVIQASGSFSSCSPNGRYVALSAWNGVQVLDLQSGAIEQVSTHASGSPMSGRVSWSPDSSRLAYDWSTGSTTSDDTDLIVVNRDGTGQDNLTPGASGTMNAYPHWTPDGQALIYYSSSYDQTEPDLSGTPRPVGRVQMRTVATGAVRPLSARASRRLGAMVLSPDGHSVAYVRSNTQQLWGGGIPDWERGYDVYRLDLDGGGELRLFEGTTTQSYSLFSWGESVIGDSAWSAPAGVPAD